ncbi:uncharacterized protein LOC114942932 [Nylanderia fulva]|uniref:uncharacterized protein LOC114942932 n=1 Tax=Nylanderia fulva TaxID=613905 RepID=UPI0010FADD50|nr:uncharacterized protein LOC114942932 [Nylanderia fulva]
MAMSFRMLLFFGTTFFALLKVNAAPARYNQRQQGEFNLQAKLENILFVVAIPSNNGALADLALQALELKHLVSSPKEEEESIKSEDLNEETHGVEPYSVEIIQINENHSNKGSLVHDTGKSKEMANISNTQTTFSINHKHELQEGFDRTAKNVKAFEFPKSREEPAIMAYFVDARKILESKIEDDGRARNVVENVWNLDAESGTSLKKQLLLRRKEDVTLPSSNTDKNDVASLSEDKQQNELRLLGDGIENCGPGRHRDASGICQFDESASALL